MKALSHCPGFNVKLTEIQSGGLKNLADCIYRTMYDYWQVFLPKKVWIDYFIDLDEFHGVTRKNITKRCRNSGKR